MPTEKSEMKTSKACRQGSPDYDSALILSLIMLLISDGGDSMLITALLYIIS